MLLSLILNLKPEITPAFGNAAAQSANDTSERTDPPICGLCFGIKCGDGVPLKRDIGVI